MNKTNWIPHVLCNCSSLEPTIHLSTPSPSRSSSRDHICLWKVKVKVKEEQLINIRIPDSGCSIVNKATLEALI